MAKTKKTAVKSTKTAKTADVTKASKDEVSVDRRDQSDRREKKERRTKVEPVNDDRRQADERRKTPRRRQIDPTTCERDYSDVEIEFMQAMDDYKRANGRMFPTCSEILEVLQKLGYEKVATASDAAEIEPSSVATELGDAESADLAEVDLEEQSPADEEI